MIIHPYLPSVSAYFSNAYSFSNVTKQCTTFAGCLAMKPAPGSCVRCVSHRLCLRADQPSSTVSVVTAAHPRAYARLVCHRYSEMLPLFLAEAKGKTRHVAFHMQMEGKSGSAANGLPGLVVSTEALAANKWYTLTVQKTLTSVSLSVDGGPPATYTNGGVAFELAAPGAITFPAPQNCHATGCAVRRAQPCGRDSLATLCFSLLWFTRAFRVACPRCARKRATSFSGTRLQHPPLRSSSVAPSATAKIASSALWHPWNYAQKPVAHKQVRKNKRPYVRECV